MAVELEINGARHRLEVDAERTLLSVLRDDLGLTGTKYGCGEGQCGACTVLIDGQPARSCTTRAANLGGRKITTIEGLAHDGRPAPGAAGVPGCGCDAVRLLHRGHDHGRRRAIGAHAAPPPRRRLCAP